MLLSDEKLDLSTSAESSSSVDEQLLENVKPNLISLTSTGSYSSHFHCDIGNLSAGHSPENVQNMDEHGFSFKDLETSLDSFTVILEEPMKSSQNSLNDDAVDTSSLQDGDMCVSPTAQNKDAVTTPDLLENCSKVSADRNNREQSDSRMFKYLKRKWSSVQDLSDVAFSPLKSESEFIYLIRNPCQSSTTISSVQKSKDSGLPRSLSCLSLGSIMKPYDHIQSKVREYISHIKKAESERKKNTVVSCKKSEDEKSLVSSLQQEPEEDLRHLVYRLQQELHDKNNIISQIQENYDMLLMKYADAENRIDRLRFKVIDSSVEEIRSQRTPVEETRSQRTREDFGIWNKVQDKSMFVNQTHSLRSGIDDVNSQVRRNLFQPSFFSGSSSMPCAAASFTANVRPVGQESAEGKLDDEVNIASKLGAAASFLTPIQKAQEDTGLPPLAFSTPNHSFSKSVALNDSSAESQQVSLRQRVAEYENREDSGTFLMRSEEENLTSEDILLEPHISDNLSLRGAHNLIRSGDKETVASIFNIISDRIGGKDTQSFLSKEFPTNEEHKTVSSETSILKVQQWQESLPPPEQIEPTCYDILTSNFSCNKKGNLPRNNSATGKTRSESVKNKCCSTECPCLNEKKFTGFPQQVTSYNFTNKNISTLYLKHCKDYSHAKKSFTDRSFLKHLPKNVDLSHERSCKSEPDLRLFTPGRNADSEVERKFRNLEEVNSHRTATNLMPQKTTLRTHPATFCEMNPLQIEPCYCWGKSMLDVQNNSQLKHCSSCLMIQDSKTLEQMVPRLKLGNFMDVNADSEHWKMDADDVHNCNIPSFVYSPSTSMSSTAVYSGHKHNAVENYLKTSDDSSTSYKIIQRKDNSSNKAVCGSVCRSAPHCGMLHVAQHKSFQNEGCPYVCKIDYMCHNCKNIKEHRNTTFRAADYVANDLWCNCCKHTVQKRSCGVNTDSDDMLHPKASENTLHKPSLSYFVCSCGVNTERIDLEESPTDHVEFLSNGSIMFQNKKCYDTGSCHEFPNNAQSNCSEQLTIMQDVQPANETSSEQSLSVIAAVSDKDACDLAQCLEEVNHIASLLKAQSESIIEVVTANLSDCIEKGDTAINMSDIA